MNISLGMLPLRRLLGIGLALFAVYSPAATLVVTSANDSGAGSLRQTIATATSGDTITFDPALNGSVITLTSGQLSITNMNLSIQGPGPSLLAINGNATSRVILVESTIASKRWNVSISGLSITNGFVSNASPGGAGGGGIRTSTSAYNFFLTFTVSNCIVRANQATTSPYEGGGGICTSRETDLTLVDCEIIDNTATVYGGGGIWCRGSAVISRCTFAGNKTSNLGGALLLRSGNLVSIRNSTFSGNSSILNGTGSAGGAIYAQEKGNVAIYNSTITTNSAKTKCGGIMTSADIVTMYLQSTIVSDNVDVQGSPDISGVFHGVTNCLIQVTNGVSVVGANNIFGQSALLEPLAYNGGLTRTHALKRKSPAIDHGYNPLNLVTDQRGASFPRLLGVAVDIGSYEFIPPPSATVIVIR